MLSNVCDLVQVELGHQEGNAHALLCQLIMACGRTSSKCTAERTPCSHATNPCGSAGGGVDVEVVVPDTDQSTTTNINVNLGAVGAAPCAVTSGNGKQPCGEA